MATSQTSDSQAQSGIDRRTFLKSGVGVAAGIAVASGGARPVVAQETEPWPVQQFDGANTAFNPDGTALYSEPSLAAQNDTPPAADANANYLLAGEHLYLHSERDGIGAITVGTGELDWVVDAGDAPLVPEFVRDGTLVARSLDGGVYAIDTDTGEVIDERAIGSGRALGYGGEDRWYAPLSDGRVIMGNRRRDPIWETSVEGVPLRPAVADGRVYVPTVNVDPGNLDLETPGAMDASGHLYALDEEDGTVIWDIERDRCGVTAPTVGDGSVYCGGTDGDLVAYDAGSGDERWRFETENGFNTSPAVLGSLVIAGNDAGDLYAINTESGDEEWRAETGDQIRAGPVVVEGTAYVGNDADSVHAIDVGTSEHQWRYDTDAPVRALTVGDSRVVAGTLAGYYVLTGGDSERASENTDGESADGQEQSDGTENVETVGDRERGEENERQRGLFSNDGGESGVASNPFNLTMLGFLLSVVGIVHQMLRGR